MIRFRLGILLIVLSTLLIGLVGCSDNRGVEVYPHSDIGQLSQNDTYSYGQSGDDYIIVIADDDFDMQMQIIQFIREDYLGRTIRYEGMFLSSYWEDEAIYFVARLSSECCGVHGFEVYLNDFEPFDDETWVEVTGILEEFYVEEAGRYFLRLNVISLMKR